MKYSCSTFMLYFGLKKEYDLKHHNVIFAPKYRQNIEDVFAGRLSHNNYSMYIRNASVLDKTLSPQGKSQFYILVPVPNKQVGKNIDWSKEKDGIRSYVLKRIKERLNLSDLEENIEAEKIITPNDWENEYNVHNGATFNLAHNLMQMLWLRPHNLLEGTKNCYLVGGGTHPGSGLPTIYESGRISAHLLMKK
jgi:phytoene desaturase